MNAGTTDSKEFWNGIEGGADLGKYSEKTLPEAERTAGSTLFCQAQPRSDLVIEALEVRKPGEIPAPARTARVQKIERPADDVMILYLEPAATERPQMLPGQYIELQLADGKRRSLSLANAPHDDELLQLHIRHTAGGAFTDTLFGTMKERDVLQFLVRDSAFYLREQSSKPILFVASGTGFAPAKAMIEHAIARGIARPITLYWGGRRPKDLYLSTLPRK